MKKLTNEQIKLIKELRSKGKKRIELANQFNVCLTTIDWHTNESFRKRFITYQKKWYSKLNQEQKTNYFNKKKEYQRIYHKNRYKTDPEFRKKQLNCSKEYTKLKGGQK